MYLGWLLVVFCQCLIVFSKENDTLVAVQMLYRHGDRTPMAVYPNDPNKKLVYRETSSAQLTNKGKERQYKLGQWLRKRYNGFLPSKYSNSDIKILTDDEDRCFMSAMSNLAGLYPPKGQQIWNKDIKWQPIPVRFNLSLQTPENCPVYEDLSNKAELELFEDICSQHGDILEYLAEKTGAEINDMATLVYTIIDPLKCEESQGLKLPKWTDTVYPKPLVDWVSLYYSLGTSSSKLAQFRIGPVFQSILDHFENVNEKVIMYSSHDSSLVDIVYTLQPNHPKFWPEFASVVILELWQNKDEEYVKLTLKRDNTIEEINIDQCGVKCNLEKFKKLVEPVALTLEKRQQLCKN